MIRLQPEEDWRCVIINRKIAKLTACLGLLQINCSQREFAAYLETSSTREKFSQILQRSYSRLCDVAVTVASSTQFLLKITCSLDPRLTMGPISMVASRSPTGRIRSRS